jgi:dimethylaniline monooxygenase (N-oxide forming)
MTFTVFSQANVISYNDSLSQQIGCMPNILRILFSDPVLALQCFFGPVHPAQYRLCGPGKWTGARKAIMEVYSNLVYPTMTRTVAPKKSVKTNRYTISNAMKFIAILLVVLVLLVICGLKVDGYGWFIAIN